MRPYKVFLFIVSLLVSLTVLCLLLPGRIAFGNTPLRWPTLTEILSSSTSTPDPLACDTLACDTIASDTLAACDTIACDTSISSISSTSSVSSAPLSSFTSALPEAPTRVVRIIHYGDSQIEEDRITQQIREGLQARYGGSGVGLIPLAQSIPTRTVRQELHMNSQLVKAQQGPRRYLVYGPKRTQRTDSLYGPMGQVAIMSDSLVRGSEDLLVVARPQVPGAQYDQWRIFADSTIDYTISGDTVHLHGQGAVYGLSQQTDTGIIVDNIPMRGSIGHVFTKIDSAQLATFYREQNVRLIILQFGGNAIPSNEKPETIRGFVQGYRKQIHYLRSCAPNASFLFIGPSDMVRLTDGQWVSYPMVAYMDQLLSRMAQDEQIAYFSLYQYMGGEGSMNTWRENGLAGNDGVHFYRSGARKAGKAILQWLLDQIDKQLTDGLN